MNSIPYGRQAITDEDVAAVVETLKAPFLTQGPRVEEFEQVFASFVGAKYALAVSNGTAGLHISALGLNKLKPGRSNTVVTSPISFVASANCARYCGFDVGFVDIGSDFCLDVNALEQRLEEGFRVDGVVPVHFAGYPIHMERLNALSKKHGFWVLEDCCHAVGAFRTRDGINDFVGSSSFSDASVFSFHPVKHIACGEGGMITTNKELLYESMKALRTHGIDKNKKMSKDEPWSYTMSELGFNYRLTDIQAALGISQMKRMPQNIDNRKRIANRYRGELQAVGDLVLPEEVDGGQHAYHLFVVRTAKRTALYHSLREKGIFTQVHYVPIYKQPEYSSLGSQRYPRAEEYYESCLSIPMFHSLTDDEQSYVIESIKAFFSSC